MSAGDESVRSVLSTLEDRSRQQSDAPPLKRTYYRIRSPRGDRAAPVVEARSADTAEILAYWLQRADVEVNRRDERSWELLLE